MSRYWKWPVAGAWLLIAVVVTIFAGSASDVESSDIRSWRPASAESTRALDLGDDQFSTDEPENLLVVYARPSGITEADRVAVVADADALRGLTATPPPVPSADGKALLLVLPLTKAQTAEGAIEPILTQAHDVVASDRPDGLAARITGGRHPQPTSTPPSTRWTRLCSWSRWRWWRCCS